MPIVAQGVVLGALPGDGGLGAATNSTPKNHGLPCLTCDFAQGNDEFWGNCVRKEWVTPGPGLLSHARHASLTRWGALGRRPTHRSAGKRFRGAAPACFWDTLPPSPPPLPDHGRPVRPEGKAAALTVINAVGIEKLKWKKHTGMNRRHGLSRGPPLVRLPPLPPLNALGRSLSHECGCFLFFPPARTKC